MGDELFVSEPFLRPHFAVTDGSKTIFLRATRLLTQREIRSIVQWLNLWNHVVNRGIHSVEAHHAGKNLHLFGYFPLYCRVSPSFSERST